MNNLKLNEMQQIVNTIKNIKSTLTIQLIGQQQTLSSFFFGRSLLGGGENWANL